MSGMIDCKSLFQIVYDAFSTCLYSFLIAASGLNLIARFAGKYPAKTPTNIANPSDISTSHHGM